MPPFTRANVSTPSNPPAQKRSHARYIRMVYEKARRRRGEIFFARCGAEQTRGIVYSTSGVVEWRQPEVNAAAATAWQRRYNEDSLAPPGICLCARQSLCEFSPSRKIRLHARMSFKPPPYPCRSATHAPLQVACFVCCSSMRRAFSTPRDTVSSTQPGVTRVHADSTVNKREDSAEKAEGSASSEEGRLRRQRRHAPAERHGDPAQKAAGERCAPANSRSRCLSQRRGASRATATGGAFSAPAQQPEMPPAEARASSSGVIARLLAVRPVIEAKTVTTRQQNEPLIRDSLQRKGNAAASSARP